MKVGVRLALTYRVDPAVMLARPVDWLFRMHDLTREVSEEMGSERDG